MRIDRAMIAVCDVLLPTSVPNPSTFCLSSNAVRDGPGMLNVNDYPNSQDFNAISEALNRIVEERVQPKLRKQVKIGATIEFVGCAEVNDEANDLRPLKVVPIQVAIP